jgi:flagellar motor switch protein FliM
VNIHHGEARLHDFRRTETLERVQLHTVSMMLDVFARHASARLSTVLRQPCTLALSSLDQLTWAEVAAGLEHELHFLTFSLSPLPGQGVVAVPTPEALAMVDLRLAGTGEEEYPERVLTEIEQELLAPVAEGVLDELATSFSRVQPTTPALEMQEANIQFVTVAAPTETCVTARLAFGLGNRPECEIVLCLPFMLLRPLAEAMRSRPGHPGDDGAESRAADVRRRLRDVPVDVVLQFPSFESTPDALMTLAVGDELHLGLPTDRPLEVRAEGLLVALATIGRSGVRKACAITEEVFS